MRAVDRWKVIEKLLYEKGHLTVPELAQKLNVSEASIRRDLVKMEEENMIKRFWGGAQIIENEMSEAPESNNFNDQYIMRFSRNLFQKSRIGKEAAKLIEDGDCIFIDAGSSTMQMLDFITAKDILVVTNGISNLGKLAKYQINTYVPQGTLNFGAGAIIGADTGSSLKSMNFDKAFLGTNTVEGITGYCSSNSYDVSIKKIVIERSLISYVLADDSKFNKRAPFTFASPSDTILITNKEPKFIHNLKGCIICSE